MTESMLFLSVMPLSTLRIINNLKMDANLTIKSQELLVHLCSSEFIVGLVVSKFVFNAVKPLSFLLQTKSSSIINSIRQCEIIKDVLNESLKNDTFGRLFEEANQIASKALTSLARSRDISDPNKKTFWKSTIFDPVIKNIISDLESRVGLTEKKMSNIEKFLPGSEAPDAQTVNEICELYRDLLAQEEDTSFETLKLQLESETIQFFKAPELHKSSILETAKHISHYPTLQRILLILETIPTSSSSAKFKQRYDTEN